MTDVLDLVGAERLTSASMFAVEFVDPFTDQPIRFGLRVWADGLGPPIRTISGRYAWNDNKPPANRRSVCMLTRSMAATPNSTTRSTFPPTFPASHPRNSSSADP